MSTINSNPIHNNNNNNNNNNELEPCFINLETGELVFIVEILEYRYIKTSDGHVTPGHLFSTKYEKV